MEFQLQTITWQSFATGLIFLGILSTWIVLIIKYRTDKKKQKSFIKKGVRLYLDVFMLKIKDILKRKELPKPGVFESENKQNHDNIEHLFLNSGSLKRKEQIKLGDFVRFFKRNPKMKTKRDFEIYQEKILAMMNVFPET